MSILNVPLSILRCQVVQNKSSPFPSSVRPLQPRVVLSSRNCLHHERPNAESAGCSSEEDLVCVWERGRAAVHTAGWRRHHQEPLPMGGFPSLKGLVPIIVHSAPESTC